VSGALQPRQGDVAALRVDDVTRRLTAWVAEVTRAAQHDTPTASSELTLLQIRPGTTPVGVHGSFALELDYRCIVTHDDPLILHQVLGEIAFAAMEGGPCTLAAAAPDQLGLVLTTRLTRQRLVARGPRVRQAPRPRIEPTACLAGVLLGPGKLPLAGVPVGLVGSDGRATTGPDGRFRLLASPHADLSCVVTDIDGIRHIARPTGENSEGIFLVTMES
jgi:hypothetical protein